MTKPIDVLVAGILWAIFCVGLYRILLYRFRRDLLARVRPERVFVIFAACFGPLFIILTPPYQAPDEFAHFGRAWQISQGVFMPGELVMALPDEFVTDEETFSHLPFNVTAKVTIGTIVSRMAPSRWNPEFDDLLIPTINHASVYHPISYLAPAVGITAASLARFPSLLHLYSGRFMNFIVWMIITAWALSLTPVFKWELFFLALLPMSLFQSVALTADSLNHAMHFLLLCGLLRLLFSEERATTKTLLVVAASVFGIACARPVYALTLLLIAWTAKRFSSLRSFGLFIALSLALITAGTAWTFLNPAPIAGDAQASWAFLTQSPATPFHVIFQTLQANLLWYYLPQYIGVLGWLDNVGYSHVYVMYTVTFIYVLVAMCLTPTGARPGIRWAAAGLFLLYVIALILALYLIWPPTAPFIAGGVQGRYFIPFMPLLLILASKHPPRQHAPFFTAMEGVGRLAILLATATGLSSYCFVLATRYFAGY